MQEAGFQTPHSSPSESNCNTRRRPPRSKRGCLTCRRRKVRCNEQKPQCSHCERLSLECKWRQPSIPLSRNNFDQETQFPNNMPSITNGFTATEDRAQDLDVPALVDESFDDVFNYASFMWNSNEFWPVETPGIGISSHQGTSITAHRLIPGGAQRIPLDDATSLSQTERSYAESGLSQPSNGPGMPTDDRLLADYFFRTAVPPILAQVETQKKWSTMRQTLGSMSSSSRMVRYAIFAFSSMLLYRHDSNWTNNTQHHYTSAAAEFERDDGSAKREHLLATLFFLSYIDLLEGKTAFAHANLKKAYDIFQKADKASFRGVEVRLLSWIRLLDARAVSAGGEGLFLSDDDEQLLASPSPGTTGNAAEPEDSSNGQANVEDVLSNVLLEPGLVFFHKVNSFMGRISKIDPWHRSRGTVEDETEVMSIALQISRDLKTLYDNRPQLIDHAVAGRLTSVHVTQNLAVTITRAFRTYMANYYSSKVHLHRVAYKSLPLTSETLHAIEMIRKLAKLMKEASDENEELPVNMLWPLVMWGCEENDIEERGWIKTQICEMENVATNARITAHVLEEVQRRQDAEKQRVDVRKVMHDIFDSCFAVV